MYADPSGHDSESIWKIIGGVGFLFSLGLLTLATAGATIGVLAALAPVISGVFYGTITGGFSNVQFSTIGKTYPGFLKV